MIPLFRRSLRVLALALGLILTAAPALAAPAPFMGDEATLGNPKAKVTVKEYASASCPHCAWFNNEVFPLFKAKYIDTGKVHYVFRELLTQPQEFAAAGFLTARCAGEAKYLAVLDAIFHDQARMYETGDLSDGLHAIGRKFGLTNAQLDACIQDPKALEALQSRLKLADKDGVQSTPTFFINGVKHEGEMSLGDLDAVIGPMLAK
jgi:protein-disulfide isomerase